MPPCEWKWADLTDVTLVREVIHWDKEYEEDEEDEEHEVDEEDEEDEEDE